MNELVSVESFTLDEAHELVSVISSRLVAINDHMEALRGEVPRLYHGTIDGQRTWAALGYASWDDLAKNEFMSAIVSLTKEERKPIVQSWRESGLSVRAIGSALGVGKSTVSDDLDQVSGTGHVTGIDGKTYTRTEKTEPPVVDGDEEYRCPQCNGVEGDHDTDPEQCHCYCEHVVTDGEIVDGEQPPAIDAEIVSEEVTEMSDEDEYPVTCGGVESPDASIRAVSNFLRNLLGMPMRPKDRDKLIKILRQALTKLETKR